MKVVYDNTWKIIKQSAGVTEKYSQDFKEIFPQLMEGRYGNHLGGALLSLIKESNPEFSIKLFEKLVDQIEIQRTKFTYAQQQLIDIQREHNNLITTFPGTVLVNNQTPIEIKIVTSEKTDSVFEIGQENEVDLF